MEAEALRCAIGLPVAALAPLVVPALRDRVAARAAVALALGAAVAAPVSPAWLAVLLVVAVAVPAVVGSRVGLARVGPRSGGGALSRGALTIVSAVAIGVGAALAVDADAVADALDTALHDHDAVTSWRSPWPPCSSAAPWSARS
jgi:hypothetical protein